MWYFKFTVFKIAETFFPTFPTFWKSSFYSHVMFFNV